jgi:hypothetical protein
VAELQISAGQKKEAAETWQRLVRECPSYAKPVQIYEKVITLARELKDEALASRCEAEIKRLAPPSPPPATNSPGK